MKENEIRDRYFDSSKLSKGKTPLVKSGDKVIAGVDNRQDVFEMTSTPEDQLRLELSNSKVILTDRADVSDNGSTYTLEVKPFRQRSLPPCSDEKFANQFVGDWCSGFLVGDDLIATAGHCGRTKDEVKN